MHCRTQAVMHQLIHPDRLKPHYEQSRVVASLSVATGLYHFVGVALPSRALSFAPAPVFPARAFSH